MSLKYTLYSQQSRLETFARQANKQETKLRNRNRGIRYSVGYVRKEKKEKKEEKKKGDRSKPRLSIHYGEKKKKKQ